MYINLSNNGIACLYLVTFFGHVSIMKDILSYSALKLEQADNLLALCCKIASHCGYGCVYGLRWLLTEGEMYINLSNNGITCIHLVTLFGHISIMKDRVRLACIMG